MIWRTFPTLLVISSAFDLFLRRAGPLPICRRATTSPGYKKTKIPEIKDRENYHRALLFTKLNLVSNLSNDFGQGKHLMHFSNPLRATRNLNRNGQKRKAERSAVRNGRRVTH